MAHPGAGIENPIIGDRVVFRRTTAETNGEVLEIDLFAAPGAKGPPEHVHPTASERFEVISGSLQGSVNGEVRTFRAGDRFTIPAGAPHTWWNAGTEEAHVRVWVEPASRMESFLETIYGLAQDGRTNAKGLPNPLQLAVFAQAYFDVNHVARPPLAVQRVIFGILAPIGRLLGYRPDHPYPYTEAAKASEPDLPGAGPRPVIS
jgi:quercetin dioxygenase-like cupin family protein